MLPPHSLATTFSNNELFEMLRHGPGANEYLRQSFALTRPEFEARRAVDLTIVVSPCRSDSTSYMIALTNSGSHIYQNVRVKYEPLLLDAGNFGLDTTHMPHEVARKSGEPIEIPIVPAGKSVQVIRTGYGSHDQYDGFYKTAIDLEFVLEGRQFSADDRRWAQVTVTLRKAKK